MHQKKDSKAEKQKRLDELYFPHREFKASPLYIPGCNSIVFGEGDPDARLIFIGEAPGKQEDLQGRPFVGRSGKLLDRALQLAGVAREDVYITNVVKCRPPNNRTPFPHELRLGKKLLLEDQVKIIHPKVICTLGSAALNGLTGEPHQITRVRGSLLDYNGITLLPAFHPAYVLRNNSVATTFLNDIIKAVELSKKG